MPEPLFTLPQTAERPRADVRVVLDDHGAPALEIVAPQRAHTEPVDGALTVVKGREDVEQLADALYDSIEQQPPVPGSRVVLNATADALVWGIVETGPDEDGNVTVDWSAGLAAPHHVSELSHYRPARITPIEIDDADDPADLDEPEPVSQGRAGFDADAVAVGCDRDPALAAFLGSLQVGDRVTVDIGGFLFAPYGVVDVAEPAEIEAATDDERGRTRVQWLTGEPLDACAGVGFGGRSWEMGTLLVRDSRDSDVAHQAAHLIRKAHAEPGLALPRASRRLLIAGSVRRAANGESVAVGDTVRLPNASAYHVVRSVDARQSEPFVVASVVDGRCQRVGVLEIVRPPLTLDARPEPEPAPARWAPGDRVTVVNTNGLLAAPYGVVDVAEEHEHDTQPQHARGRVRVQWLATTDIDPSAQFQPEMIGGRTWENADGLDRDRREHDAADYLAWRLSAAHTGASSAAALQREAWLDRTVQRTAIADGPFLVGDTVCASDNAFHYVVRDLIARQSDDAHIDDEQDGTRRRLPVTVLRRPLRELHIARKAPRVATSNAPLSAPLLPDPARGYIGHRVAYFAALADSPTRAEFGVVMPHTVDEWNDRPEKVRDRPAPRVVLVAWGNDERHAWADTHDLVADLRTTPAYRAEDADKRAERVLRDFARAADARAAAGVTLGAVVRHRLPDGTRVIGEVTDLHVPTAPDHVQVQAYGRSVATPVAVDKLDVVACPSGAAAVGPDDVVAAGWPFCVEVADDRARIAFRKTEHRGGHVLATVHAEHLDGLRDVLAAWVEARTGLGGATAATGDRFALMRELRSLDANIGAAIEKSAGTNGARALAFPEIPDL